MGKRQVITRFVAASAAWLILWGAVALWIGGLRGDAVFAVAIVVLLAVAWGAFTPNSPVFGRVIGRGRTEQPLAAITFDDGPSPEHTPPILDALRERGVRATFFVLGRNVRAHPEIVKRIVDDGHELASHGDDHSILTFRGRSRWLTSCGRWRPRWRERPGPHRHPSSARPTGFAARF